MNILLSVILFKITMRFRNCFFANFTNYAIIKNNIKISKK